MTPFPEAEIMTIKRLEVAIRKMDYKLLKDGAYKLHEKYHSGHRFEYLDLLKEIYLEITNNPSVPQDVKDILSPTIEDILSQQEIKDNTSDSYDNLVIKEEELQEEQKEAKINAFDAFSPQKPQVQPTRFFSQSPFSAEPFKGFNTSKQEPTIAPVYEEPEMHEEIIEETKEEMHEIQEQYCQEVAKETMQEFSENYAQEEIPKEEVIKEEYQTQAEQQIEQPIEVKQAIFKEKKSVAIYYAQDNSNEKIKNIVKLRELIKNTREKNSSIDDLLVLISEITTQADTNIIELQGVLEQLSNKGNVVNLITNSQSSMFYELLEALQTTYSFYENKDNNKMNIIPLYGMSNLFVCEECQEKYIDKSYGAKPLIVECPKCKHPMYPDFYAAVENEQVNLEYYSQAMVNLANSKVWLLIHPSFSDKNSSDLLLSALKVSSKVEEIYILEKDINTKEMYRNTISQLKPEVKVNIQGNVLEDFFNFI